MRHKTVRIGLAGLIFTLLIGCAPHIRTKTILLPERENSEENLNSGSDELYTVQKIYSREINSGINWAPEIYPAQDHRFRYWSAEEQEGMAVCVETTLDYRYGFHEERELPLEQETRETLKLLQETTEQQQGCDVVSPDGRYAVFVDRTHSDTGEKLYLLNLFTGDSMVLLDGDKMECPGNEYRIVTGWSPDSEILCYGFCPKLLTEEGARYDTKAVIHFRKLETGEQTSAGMLYWEEGMELGEIKNVWLYGDWKGEKARAAFVYTLASEQEKGDEKLFYVQWIFMDMSEQKKVTRIGWPSMEVRLEEGRGNLPVYLDAEQDQAYIVQEEGISIYSGYGTHVGSVDSPPDTEILQLQAADGGNAFITIETDQNTPGKPEDICLYRRNDSEFVRSILYKGCGYVHSMKYEPEYQRLLVSAQGAMEEKWFPFHTWQGIVLEFQ